MEIVIMLLIGAFAGWLASVIYRNSGLGPFGNIITGILGSAASYWVIGELGIILNIDLVGTILCVTIGAMVIICIVNILFSGRKI
jgi:uncharacterized membrane protein YeaQ/YmgE (transglycosylase-associated protein family)